MPEKSLKCITFSGDYSLLKNTKSGTKQFPSGIQTSIVTYNAGDNPISKGSYPGTPIGATSEANGNLVLNGGAYLFIPNGIYDFYAVSTNTSSIPSMSFTNGISSGLLNGTDYLWASNKNLTIMANTFVPLRFLHRSSAITISIVAGEGVSNLLVKNILIAQSQEGAAMSLSSGIIPAANKLSPTMAFMNVFSNTGTFIMLPIKSGISIPFEVYADSVFGEKAVLNKRFTATIPAPDGGFESGIIYKFTASMESFGVIFLKSSLEDWDEENLMNISLTE